MAGIILQTKNHWAYQGSDPDTIAFLDIDIGILAQPEPAYRKYSLAVRQEWLHAGGWELLFDLGRGVFLSKVLKQAQIFLGAEFRQKYDSQARRNLAQELEDLLSKRGFLLRSFIKFLNRKG